VTLGLGSVVASAISMAPWLAILSRHKIPAFGLSAALLALNYWLVVVRPRRCAPGELCHVDSPMMRVNRRLFWFSTGVFALAILVTFGSSLVLGLL
jgi:hypothetical protein